MLAETCTNEKTKVCCLHTGSFDGCQLRERGGQSQACARRRLQDSTLNWTGRLQVSCFQGGSNQLNSHVSPECQVGCSTFGVERLKV